MEQRTFDCGLVVTVLETDDGLEVSVRLPEDQHNAWNRSHDSGCDLVSRSVALPTKGSRVMVRGKLHKVKDRFFDDNKHCFFVDADTGENVLWA